MESIAIIVGVITSLVSISISFTVMILSLRFRSETSIPEKLANIPQNLSNQYIDRNYSFTEKNGKKKTIYLREARLLVEEKTKIKDKWNKFVSLSMKTNTWENRFSYEVSIGLEWVGAMVLVGAIPLSLVLSQDSNLILRDWIYCKNFVEKIRYLNQYKPQKIFNASFIGYQRRHAEWLAYAAAIYLHKNWQSDEFENLINPISTINIIKNREQILRKLEWQTIPLSTRRDLNKILGRCALKKTLENRNVT